MKSTVGNVTHNILINVYKIREIAVKLIVQMYAENNRGDDTIAALRNVYVYEGAHDFLCDTTKNLPTYYTHP